MSSPGWYPDPGNSLRERYWDGHRWAVEPPAAPRRQMKPAKILGWVIALGIGTLLVINNASGSSTSTTPVVGSVPAYIAPQVQVNSGYEVTCEDGTISHAGGKRGACSHHGGER